MTFTILGGQGFIGSHMADHWRAMGHECRVPERDDPLEGDLGHVIYGIGITADFRRRPLDTLEAHVCRLLPLLRQGRFDSLLYLSSTRIFSGAASGGHRFRVDPEDPSDLYNLSKLTGEAACLAMNRPTVRIARLSNVVGLKIGSDDFLASLIHDALTRGHIHLRSDPASAKDYVAIRDVVRMAGEIALNGRERIYNLGSGEKTSHATIVAELVRLTGCGVTMVENAPRLDFSPIDIQPLREEFGYRPTPLTDLLAPLVTAYRTRLACHD